MLKLKTWQNFWTLSLYFYQHTDVRENEDFNW